MSFNRARRNRDPFGPRFGELMGKTCHQAITAAARGKREQFDALVKDLYQMLDSIETETTWPEDIVKKVQATESMNPKTEKKDEPTPVAPESEPAAKDTGDKSPPKKRTKKATRPSGGAGNSN